MPAVTRGYTRIATAPGSLLLYAHDWPMGPDLRWGPDLWGGVSGLDGPENVTVNFIPVSEHCESSVTNLVPVASDGCQNCW